MQNIQAGTTTRVLQSLLRVTFAFAFFIFAFERVPDLDNLAVIAIFFFCECLLVEPEPAARSSDMTSLVRVLSAVYLVS